MPLAPAEYLTILSCFWPYLPKVSPSMTPFYIWFMGITSFLIAAMLAGAFPSVTLPVPWTGIAVVGIVVSVSALPTFYGGMFIRDAALRSERRETSSCSDNDSSARDAVSFSGAVTGDCRLEDDLIGGETYPLLGSVENLSTVRAADVDSCNLTWKQCMKVSYSLDSPHLYGG